MDGGGENSRIPNLQDLRTKAIALRGLIRLAASKLSHKAGKERADLPEIMIYNLSFNTELQN